MFLPQDYLLCEQDPERLIEGAKFALKLFIFFIVIPLGTIGLLCLFSQWIVVPQFNGTELF